MANSNSSDHLCYPALFAATLRQQLTEVRGVISLLLVTLVLSAWGQAGWIYAKAELAQYLIHSAWDEALNSPVQGPAAFARPWPWADTWPVARLQAPRQQADLWVLEGADGSALAFGPGHMQGTALPGQGASLIGGHRDTHFAFLQDLQIGDPIRVQDQQGQWHEYRTQTLRIVDSRNQPLLIDTDTPQLLLVTCYPFKALQPGGPLRYLVIAEPVTTSVAGVEPIHVAAPSLYF